ncbi:hypothetical protein [Metabacillus halosaccharovorans]
MTLNVQAINTVIHQNMVIIITRKDTDQAVFLVPLAANERSDE